jgi:hypothetical protein
VERLVIATVIDPLRREWEGTQATADRQKSEGKGEAAIATVRTFHEKLCNIRVLDPACGTGNFLYVSLELMKSLEGQVLEALADLGGQEALTGLQGHTVDPHQFLGLEVNPRAAAIAELVLWIGHLQLHFRNNGSTPREPILEAFHNIKCVDALLRWDGYPLPKVSGGKETYSNPRRPDWPEADFIVGNPPFVGGKDIRARMGSGYAEALWKAHAHMNESADFVMYWWDRSAEILRKPKSRLKRFGFVTTNSISQVFQRRVMERHLSDKKPLSIVMAIPDHPWTKVTRDSAAVRIAMTVAEAGKKDGRLMEVTAEEGVETDSPVILFAEKDGKINSDLTVGVDVTKAAPLKSNTRLSLRGMTYMGEGFILDSDQRQYFCSHGAAYGEIIKPYLSGRDLVSRPRGVFAVDLFGLTIDRVRDKLPQVYQHLLQTVKPTRDKDNRPSYRERWWVFAEPRQELRATTQDLTRYIGTSQTAKHRVFQFLDRDWLPDQTLVIIASSCAFVLGVVSSRMHLIWSQQQGGTLEDRPRYTNSRCFDPFPFPAATDAQKATIGAIAEELDVHRKRVLAEHDHLTLTGLYNVLERLRAGVKPADLDPKERRIFHDGLLLILKELHDKLDVAVAEAYGWPADLPEEEVLARLVALNKEREKEEARGLVRWLRPEYQIPRFGSAKERAEQIEADLGQPAEAIKGPKPLFPTSDDRAQTGLVIQTLLEADQPLDAAAIAARFKQGQKVRPAVVSVLASLHRTGLVSSPDRGRTFNYRRAA